MYGLQPVPFNAAMKAAPWKRRRLWRLSWILGITGFGLQSILPRLKGETWGTRVRSFSKSRGFFLVLAVRMTLCKKRRGECQRLKPR
jgi:hypothetical protein